MRYVCFGDPSISIPAMAAASANFPPVFSNLAIDESEVEPDGSLINDYGGESIDFLDLVYRLEREFKVKIPRGQIEKEARGALEDEAFAENGKLTEEGMVQLKDYLAEVC